MLCHSFARTSAGSAGFIPGCFAPVEIAPLATRQRPWLPNVDSRSIVRESVTADPSTATREWSSAVESSVVAWTISSRSFPTPKLLGPIKIYSGGKRTKGIELKKCNIHIHIQYEILPLEICYYKNSLSSSLWHNSHPAPGASRNHLNRPNMLFL